MMNILKKNVYPRSYLHNCATCPLTLNVKESNISHIFNIFNILSSLRNKYGITKGVSNGIKIKTELGHSINDKNLN